MRNDITPPKNIFNEALLIFLQVAVSVIPVGAIEAVVVKAAMKVFQNVAKVWCMPYLVQY